MSNKKIDGLPIAGALTGTEPAVIVQGGVTVQTTTQDIADLNTTPTLQQTITESNVVNDGVVLQSSPDGFYKIELDEDAVGMTIGATSFGNTINFDVTSTNVNSGTVLNLAAPSVQKNGVEIATVNDIPTTDTTIIDGSTNPVSGNAVFDGLALKKDNIQMIFFPGVLNPADSTTYYFSNRALTPSLTATNHAFKLGYNGTIKSAIIMEGSNTTSGSTESSTIQLRNITQATSSVISSAVKTNGSTTQLVTNTETALNVSFLGTDDICLQLDTPAFATNPINCSFTIYLTIEKTS